MAKFIERIMSGVQRIVDRFNGNGLMQDSNVPAGEGYVTDGMPELIRRSAAEGTVLLQNDGVLPFKSQDRIALFGRCQVDWFYVGYGSGGDVKPPYKISFIQAMKEADAAGKFKLDQALADIYEKWCTRKENVPSQGWWGHWPMNYPEMPLTEDLIRDVAGRNDIAVFVIGRAAGEDRENTLTQGSYYLTDTEIEALDLLTSHFAKTVVIMDCGNVIDMSWTAKYEGKLSAIVYAWQGGMESGHALVDVLTGDTNPCGKLPDTIAARYEDYPSSKSFGNADFNEYTEDIYVGYRYFETFARNKVLYPFGYGLSYTHFEFSIKEFSADGGRVHCALQVKNIGQRVGREVVQLYVAAPQGKLGKAVRTLADFKKTDLLQPGESQILTLGCDYYAFASFDDTGACGNGHCYVLEKGEYEVFVGSDVRAQSKAGQFLIMQDTAVKSLPSVCAVRKPFKRLCAEVVDGKIVETSKAVPAGQNNLRQRILNSLPQELERKDGAEISFDDVVDGKATLEEFVAQLDEKELQALTRGYGSMNAPQGINGNAGAYGGIIPQLADRGVPAVIVADGPAGIRIGRFTALLPCGTALASTWDTELMEKLYECVGREMQHYGVDALLGAGMNIHRNPLCGRNFEYFSEDPLLSGKMAAAFTRGVQSNGKIACPKHFACNNQETNRNYNDSIVSERALREIYLKGFEICVKESSPCNIMTSYNKINGVWSHYNYDLATSVLRDEWGYNGLVITDWWMRKSNSEEFPNIRDNAYRVRAQVDVFMPGNFKYGVKKYKPDKSLLETLGKQGGITRGELQRTALNTLAIALRVKIKQKRDMEKQNART